MPFLGRIIPQNTLSKVIKRAFLAVFKGSFLSGKQNMPINDIGGEKVAKYLLG